MKFNPAVVGREQVRPIVPDEYRERQDRARRKAAEQGYDGLIAWSRGGAAQDQFADVYYLAGFYTHFPTLPDDEHGRWRSRGHAALLLPASGPSTLIEDVTQLRADEAPVADSICCTTDPVAQLASAISEQLPDGGRLALLGGAVLAHRWWTALQELLPHHVLVEADQLGSALRLVKSPAEQDLLRVAGAVGAAAVDAAMVAAVAGASEADVAAAAIDPIVRAGGAFYGMGLSSGASAHTFSPTQPAAYDGRQHLTRGDLVRLDLYGSIEGYMFDFGRSKVVDADPTPAQLMILDAVRDSVQAGIDCLQPGRTLGGVATACEDALLDSEFARDQDVQRSSMGSWGHSLGLCWEGPWIEPTDLTRIEPGMCLAVELRLEAPGVGGANYEDNILVTEHGPEILSAAAQYH